MIWMALTNSCLGMIILITFCFCLGDVGSAILTPTGQPHIQIMYNATQYIPDAIDHASTTIIMAVYAHVSNVATCWCQLFALVGGHGVALNVSYAMSDLVVISRLTVSLFRWHRY